MARRVGQNGGPALERILRERLSPEEDAGTLSLSSWGPMLNTVAPPESLPADLRNHRLDQRVRERVALIRLLRMEHGRPIARTSPRRIKLDGPTCSGGDHRAEMSCR